MENYNIIGIDPSLISTAVTIESNGTTKLFNFFKDKKLNKWEKIAEDFINLKFINYKDYKKMNNSEVQISKHKDYKQIVKQISATILDNIDDNKETIVGIEGYSYSSSAGPLIDLVTFSTLLRDELLQYVTTNIIVITPGELKKTCAMIVYDKGEDGAYRNNEIQKNGKGTAGGSFKKHDMARALIDFYGKTGKIINQELHKFLMEYKEDLFNMKGFPKPFDDIIDSLWLKETLKQKLITLSA